mmetsp:Transcript_36746/g.71258  ORF Transcript_36746/g.71258 Transcript_36746/m.71258 type:complete len:261 (+) Transcript_36746:686-1468(+)
MSLSSHTRTATTATERRRSSRWNSGRLERGLLAGLRIMDCTPEMDTALMSASQGMASRSGGASFSASRVRNEATTPVTCPPSGESRNSSALAPSRTTTPREARRSLHGSKMAAVALALSHRTSKSPWCSNAKNEKHDRAAAALISGPGAIGSTSSIGSRKAEYSARETRENSVEALMPSYLAQALSPPSKSSHGPTSSPALARSARLRSEENVGHNAVPRGAGRRGRSPRTGATTVGADGGDEDEEGVFFSCFVKRDDWA